MIGTSKKRIRRFMGTIPKKSEKNFTFGGIALHHRSVKTETLLVHMDTKAVIAAFPYGTKREVILEAVAKNHDKLLHFISSPQSYELYDTEETFGKVVKEASEQTIEPISMDNYSDGSCVAQREVEKPVVKKKTYNLNERGEW